MTLSQVSLLFLVQMAFGSLLTFVVNDRAGLGPKYFKFGGWVLVGLYGLALTLAFGPLADRTDPLLLWSLVAATAGMLAFSSVSGWDRPRLETGLLLASVVAGGVVVAASALWAVPGALADTVAAGSTATELAPAGPTAAALTPTELALVLAGAFCSALVLGFSTWGMILGHWYLVSRDLAIHHLGRLVAPLPWIFGFKTLVSAAALWLMWDRFLGPTNRSLDDIVARQPERILDVVNVWARIPVGLLVPAVLAFMTKVTVRMEKTQPATGILYAMCVLVYLGDLIGKMVEGATGVPL